MKRADLLVYTAQLRYSGADRLDVTVKGKDPVGKHFAPTWDMVNGWNSGKLTEPEYTTEYMEMMRRSYRDNRMVWDELLSREEVTLCCFCRPGIFCHRILLAGILEKLGAEYGGERPIL